MKPRRTARKRVSLRRRRNLGSSLALAAIAASAWGQGLSDPLPDIPFGPHTVRLEDVLQGRLFPLDVAEAPDGTGRLFVNQNDGSTYVLQDGNVLPTPFLALDRTYMFNGSALAGVAFHPDFAADELAGIGGRVYVSMTDDPGTGPADFGIASGEVHQSVVYEVRVSATDPNVADPTSLRALVRINEVSTIHNVADIAFGPDGYLYIAKGDDQMGGQDTTDVHGKILRIDVDRCPGNPLSANGEYAIPADNPFVGDIAGLDEVWAYGFRNPWRMGFDRTTGELFVADIGERDIEEVNRIALAADGAAQNYGWPEMEGSFRYLGPGNGVTDDLSGLPSGFDAVDPVGEYDHGQVDNSISGGVVYRGSALPELVGQFIFADWISGSLFQLDLASGTIQRIAIDPNGAQIHGQPPFASGDPAEGVIAVREDTAGELLLVVAQRNLSETGRIVRVLPATCLAETSCASTVNSTGSAATLQLAGSASLAANDLELVAGPVPSGVPGLFFYGNQPLQAPFGDGVRCAGGQVVRIFPIAVADGSGQLTTALDNGDPRHAGLRAGVTRYFQAWFRDAPAGAAGFNLSSGLEVRFCR